MVCATYIKEKINNMTKIIEKNLAELIVVGVFTLCFFSSCGIQFGNYERWKEVYGNDTCQVDEREYEFTTLNNNCENCDEID